MKQKDWQDIDWFWFPLNDKNTMSFNLYTIKKVIIKLNSFETAYGSKLTYLMEVHLKIQSKTTLNEAANNQVVANLQANLSLDNDPDSNREYAWISLLFTYSFELAIIPSSLS